MLNYSIPYYLLYPPVLKYVNITFMFFLHISLYTSQHLVMDLQAKYDLIKIYHFSMDLQYYEKVTLDLIGYNGA